MQFFNIDIKTGLTDFISIKSRHHSVQRLIQH